ncbi:uncharacterized protein TNCV_60571 [Trichonephila clavipes]|nr:uncharacterized protein TNCV_60571 [Trichonephila clavipes]
MFRGSGGEGFPRIRFPYVPDRKGLERACGRPVLRVPTGERRQKRALHKHNSKTIDKVRGQSESVSLNPCTIRSKENGVVMPVLRETGASLDIGCEKYAAPEMFTGEHASIKHILDNGMTCLRPAELEIECRMGHVVSKPVANPVHLDKEKYNDQFGLGEYLFETEENLVPSLTKEDQDTMNLIKINAYDS